MLSVNAAPGRKHTTLLHLHQIQSCTAPTAAACTGRMEGCSALTPLHVPPCVLTQCLLKVRAHQLALIPVSILVPKGRPPDFSCTFSPGLMFHYAISMVSTNHLSNFAPLAYPCVTRLYHYYLSLNAYTPCVSPYEYLYPMTCNHKSFIIR